MHLSVIVHVATHSAIYDWMQRFRMPFQDNYVLWKTIGFGGMFIFGSRTFVQWIHSERHRESKIPVMFWWLSVVGTVLCLAYAVRQKDSVFTLMYTFNMIPYVRNLMLIHKRKKQQAGFALAVADSRPQPLVGQAETSEI